MTTWDKILEGDLRWREEELTSLKRIARINRGNEVVYRATLRAIWAMLYAHYEGFTKFCWELLLDQIQHKGTSIEELVDEFLILALENRFREIRGNSSSVRLWTFFRTDLPSALKGRAAFTSECRLQTDSNLWPDVFKRECEKIGIVSSEMALHEKRIKALVSRRNEIAHGQKMTIASVEEYSVYEDCALLVMHDLAVKVFDILQQETYLRNERAEMGDGS